MKSCLYLLSILPLITAQIWQRGECPDIPVQANFSSTEYVGRWYEWARSPTLDEAFGKCVYSDTSPPQDGKIELTTFQRRPITGLRTSSKIKFTPIQPGEYTKYFNYNVRVVATDYDRYSVLLLCANSFFKTRHSVILTIETREQKPDYATVIEAQARIVMDMGLTLDDLRLTEQDKCPEKEDQLFG